MYRTRHLFMLLTVLFLSSIPFVAYAQDSAHSLPAPLYFVAFDAQGMPQVWQFGQADSQPHQITSEPSGVHQYAIAPTGNTIAYLADSDLIIADINGQNRRTLTQIETEKVPSPVGWAAAGSSVSWNVDGTWLAFHDEIGVWIVPADASQPPRMLIGHIIPQVESSDIRIYREPRWSPDGAQVLVKTHYYEGSAYGVIDVATAAYVETILVNDDVAWTPDGRMMGWSSIMEYQSPGVFLADPATPAADPLALVLVGTPVHDVFQRTDGALFIISATSPDTPDQIHIRMAESLGEPFVPVSNPISNSDFLPLELIVSDSGAPLVAGIIGDSPGEIYFAGDGEIALLDPSTGSRVNLGMRALVQSLQWGPNQ